MKLAEILKEVFGGMSREIAARRAEVLAPELRPGEAMPDAELEHELYLRLLDRRLDGAIAAEQAYRRAAIRDKSLRRRRDRATAELNRQLGGLRQIVDLARGKGSSARLLDIKGRTERRQQGIYDQTSDLLARIDELTPGKPVLAGVSNDPRVWRGMIEPAYRQLGDLRQLFVQQEKIGAGLLIAKDKAFALFDETARGLVHIAEGECRLVGRNDLAKRIRRFSRKRLRPGPKPKKKKKGKKAKKKKAQSLAEKLLAAGSAKSA